MPQQPQIISDEAHIDMDVQGDILIMRYFGAFDAETYRHRLEPAIKLIRQPGARWRLLSDVSQAQMRGLATLKAGAAFTKANAPYVRRSAVLGLRSSARRFLYNRMVALSGRANVRAFDDADAAMTWLKRDD